MREMPRAARLYLAGCYLLGLAALVWLTCLASWQADERSRLLTAALAVLAATAQVFTVARAQGHHSDHLTPAPIFAAVLLLPAPFLALVVCFTFIPEWIVHRRRWFIQLFNIASWLIAAAGAREVIHALAGRPELARQGPLNAGVILLALAVFLALSTFLLAWVLRLARRQSLRETGLFVPAKLFSEIALLCSGWAFAAAWAVDPYYAIPAVLPLLVIFQALHVPNLIVEASTDPKTGLANMRHVNAVLPRELERAERTGQPGSVLMCDLDYLRTINNTYGHPVGDIVLAGVADVIRQNVRACDLAGRFGGEEFIIYLLDTPQEGAWQVGERIRGELEHRRFPTGEGNQTVGATVSIGLASYPLDGSSYETLLREADLALYQAKREGRNRVIAAGRASRELVGDWARDNVLPAQRDPGSTGRLPFIQFGSQLLRTRPPAPVGQAAEPPVQEQSPRPLPAAPVRQGLLGIFIAYCLAAALALLLPGLTGLLHSHIPWLGLLFFASLVIVAEQLSIDLDGRSQTSVSVVAILATAFLYGRLGILVVAAIFALWAKLKSHSPLHRMLFNFAMIALAATVANAGFRLLAREPLDGAGFARLALLAAASGLIYYLINHALLSTVRGLNEGRSVVAIFRADYQWLWPYYAVFGLLGLTVAEAYIAFGWAGVLAIAAPVAMVRFSIKQYMERTAVYVNELKLVNQRLTDSYEATLQALSRALDTRDAETEEHSQRVRRYSQLIARRCGLSEEEIEHLCRGALLHDIGKIGVPDAVLLKRGRLTEPETELMRRHPTIGFTMIAHIPFLTKAAEVVLHHHESFDGSGYPSGLSAHRIPLVARIFTVVDALDAMTSNRPYRQALPFTQALDELRRCSGTQFDPHIVDIVLAIPLDELIACSRGDLENLPATYLSDADGLAIASD